MEKIIISEIEAGQRLDKLLFKYFNDAPKSFIYKMLRKKNIILNGKKATGAEKVSKNDEINLYLAKETIQKFQKEESYKKIQQRTTPSLAILYEDSNILVMNKPAGLLSQKSKPQDCSLNERMIAYLLASGEQTVEQLQYFRPSICNRLDRNTSGIVIAGKTIESLQKMADLLREHHLKKYYCCMVHGCFSKAQTRTAYLQKDVRHNQVMVTTQKQAGSVKIQAVYTPIWQTKEYSYIEVQLITGKSHQIRADLASLGYPILGDRKYGYAKEEAQKDPAEQKLGRLLLHASRVVFPTLEAPFEALSNLEITAPLPKIFQSYVDHFKAAL